MSTAILTDFCLVDRDPESLRRTVYHRRGTEALLRFFCKVATYRKASLFCHVKLTSCMFTFTLLIQWETACRHVLVSHKNLQRLSGDLAACQQYLCLT